MSLDHLFHENFEEGHIQERSSGESLQGGTDDVPHQTLLTDFRDHQTYDATDGSRGGEGTHEDDCLPCAAQSLGEPEADCQGHDDFVEDDGQEERPDGCRCRLETECETFENRVG